MVSIETHTPTTPNIRHPTPHLSIGAISNYCAEQDKQQDACTYISIYSVRLYAYVYEHTQGGDSGRTIKLHLPAGRNFVIN